MQLHNICSQDLLTATRLSSTCTTPFGRRSILSPLFLSILTSALGVELKSKSHTQLLPWLFWKGISCSELLRYITVCAKRKWESPAVLLWTEETLKPKIKTVWKFSSCKAMEQTQQLRVKTQMLWISELTEPTCLETFVCTLGWLPHQGLGWCLTWQSQHTVLLCSHD